MILHAVDQDRFASDMLCNTGHVSPQAGPKVRIMEERHPVFGAEHHVEDDVGMELGLVANCRGPLDLCTTFLPDTRAFAHSSLRPGLACFAPFGARGMQQLQSPAGMPDRLDSPERRRQPVIHNVTTHQPQRSTSSASRHNGCRKSARRK